MNLSETQTVQQNAENQSLETLLEAIDFDLLNQQIKHGILNSRCKHNNELAIIYCKINFIENTPNFDELLNESQRVNTKLSQTLKDQNNTPKNKKDIDTNITCYQFDALDVMKNQFGDQYLSYDISCTFKMIKQMKQYQYLRIMFLVDYQSLEESFVDQITEVVNILQRQMPDFEKVYKKLMIHYVNTGDNSVQQIKNQLMECLIELNDDQSTLQLFLKHMINELKNQNSKILDLKKNPSILSEEFSNLVLGNYEIDNKEQQFVPSLQLESNYQLLSKILSKLEKEILNIARQNQFDKVIGMLDKLKILQQFKVDQNKYNHVISQINDNINNIIKESLQNIQIYIKQNSLFDVQQYKDTISILSTLNSYKNNNFQYLQPLETFQKKLCEYYSLNISNLKDNVFDENLQYVKNIFSLIKAINDDFHCNFKTQCKMDLEKSFQTISEKICSWNSKIFIKENNQKYLAKMVQLIQKLKKMDEFLVQQYQITLLKGFLKTFFSRFLNFCQDINKKVKNFSQNINKMSKVKNWDSFDHYCQYLEQCSGLYDIENQVNLYQEYYKAIEKELLENIIIDDESQQKYKVKINNGQAFICEFNSKLEAFKKAILSRGKLEFIIQQ